MGREWMQWNCDKITRCRRTTFATPIMKGLGKCYIRWMVKHRIGLSCASKSSMYRPRQHLFFRIAIGTLLFITICNQSRYKIHMFDQNDSKQMCSITAWFYLERWDCLHTCDFNMVDLSTNIPTDSSKGKLVNFHIISCCIPTNTSMAESVWQHPNVWRGTRWINKCRHGSFKT